MNFILYKLLEIVQYVPLSPSFKGFRTSCFTRIKL